MSNDKIIDDVICILADIANSLDIGIQGARNLADHAYKKLKTIRTDTEQPDERTPRYSIEPTDGSISGEFLVKDGFKVAVIFYGNSNDIGGEARRICDRMNQTSTQREGEKPDDWSFQLGNNIEGMCSTYERIVKQYEGGIRKYPHRAAAQVDAMRKALQFGGYIERESGSVSVEDYMEAISTMADGLEGHQSISFTNRDLAEKALQALLPSFVIRRRGS